MRSIASPKSRATRYLGNLPLLLALVGAAPVPAQARRPAPEIIDAKLPPTTHFQIAAPGAIRAISRPRVCGTSDVVPVEAEGVRLALHRWQDEHVSVAPGGTIRVAFHVITARGEGNVSDQRLNNQIGELNRDYAGSGYRFELASVDRTDEPGWFRMTPGSGKERKAKQALAIDPAHHLNIYSCSPGQGLLGWAQLPWSAPESNSIHGVVLDHASLPGGETPFDPGRVATHQVGHYLGLLHADHAGGVRSAELSPGQVERVRAIVPVYRPSLFIAPVARVAAGPEIAPGAGAEPEEGRVLAYRGAFPNPFRAETALRFTLPSSQLVSLRIYSVTGQLVRTLVDAPLPPGDHSAMFRAEGLPSGAYFAVLRAGQVQMSRTLMLVR